MQKEIEEFAKDLIAVAEQNNKRTLTAKEIKQIQDFAESWLLLGGSR